MNTVRAIARDLVDKRLWPVAALLGLGILVALAVALSASGSEPQQAGAPALAGGGPADGVVAAAEPSELNADRDLLGDANDPFRRSGSGGESGAPQGAEQPPSGATADSGVLGGGAPGGALAAGGLSGLGGADVPSGIGGGGSAAGAGGGGTSTGVKTGPVQTPEPPARRERDASFTMWEVDVRVFRGATQVRDIDDIAPLTPLPTAKRPAALFLGAFNGGSSAGFLIHRFTRVEGSNCEARAPRDCSLLRLAEGRSARLSFDDDGRKVSYTVVVDDIRKVTTRDARRARDHRERQSRIGACLLKSLGQDYGAVLFDRDQGTWSAGGSLESCLKR